MKNPRTPDSNNDMINNPFANEDRENNIIVVVEDRILYVNGDTLKMLSPVFRAMLSEHFVEGIQRKIQLEGKKVNDVITMFRFFYPSEDIDFTEKFDFYSLLILCEEYQLSWLQKKTMRYLVTSFNTMLEYREGEMVVYLLYLAERFNNDELKNKCLERKLKTSYSMENVYENVTFLTKNSKRAVYKSFLSKRMTECDERCKRSRLQRGVCIKDAELINATDTFFN